MLILAQLEVCHECDNQCALCSARTGMKKNSGGEISFKYGLGRGPCKTIPENIRITGKVILPHNGFEYVSTTT